MNIRNSEFWQRIFKLRAQDSLPLHITHQRIYVLPTKCGVAFLITLVLMLVATVNYSLALGYALCFLLTGLFSATLLHSYKNLAGLCVNAVSSQDVFAGESVVFNVSLENSQNRPRHGITISGRGNVNAIIRLEAATAAEAQLTIKSEQRGLCKLGRVTIQSDWPLGFWSCWCYLHTPHQALVFPTPEMQAPPLPAVGGDAPGILSNTANQGDVDGLRDYQPGDSIGSIAWKHAARGLGLKARTFDSEQSRARTVIDIESASVPGIEAKLSRLCAWVLLAEQNRTSYGFRLAGVLLDSDHGKEQQSIALKALAEYPSADNPVA